MNIFFGLIFIVAGVFYIKYSKKITEAIGSIEFAEKILGPGGTYTLHKLIGVLIIVLSFMTMTGALQAILRSTLGRLFGGLAR